MIDTVRQRTVQYTHNKYAYIGLLRETRYTIYNRMERGNKKASVRVLLTLKRSFYIYIIYAIQGFYVYIYIAVVVVVVVVVIRIVRVLKYTLALSRRQWEKG